MGDMVPGPNISACVNCVYSVVDTWEHITCHRFPPTPNPAVDWAEWPEVRGTDWCGEWTNSRRVALSRRGADA